ncbi:hypothetical protein F5148DRAFT_1273481 [Russula earlei]|uniref:Uncharacterized protein n=1 Tax=Russula earlei TaxID=71964 RepID=A0ACC0UP62_9AGAM|nr:hypothetical protein F5148DRAFT_1273481 [Russula earlei]
MKMVAGPPVSCPPVHSPRFYRQPSPLRPADTLPSGKGLDRGRFEALLASTRERNASAKREPDLRKELALKAHKNKQMERRALFLSKVQAPPSPTATALPKTPPESPAIFHYSLPSPGLDSPLALFEALQKKETTGPIRYPSVRPWVEQVHYRHSKGVSVRPSLEQISARLSSHGYSATAKDEHHRPPIPLPTFLRPLPSTNTARSASRPPVAPSKGMYGRVVAEVVSLSPSERGELHPPISDADVLSTLSRPRLHVTTTMIPPPPPSRSCLTELTEVNLNALNTRTLTGRDMMLKLKRRTSKLAAGRSSDEDERRARRVSAPAELSKRERNGFAHPVLALPGAF